MDTLLAAGVPPADAAKGATAAPPGLSPQRGIEEWTWGSALDETAFNVFELSGGREGRVAGGILVRTQGPDLVCHASMTPAGVDGSRHQPCSLLAASAILRP